MTVPQPKQEQEKPQSTKKSSGKDTEFLTDEKAEEAGWFGQRPEGPADEEYALSTGPDAPHGENGPV